MCIRDRYGGHSTHIPLKVNQAGVIPIIFASSVLMFPITIAQFVQNDTVQWIASYFAWGTVTNTVMYAVLIMFFTYFYTAISLNIPQPVSYTHLDVYKRQASYRC